jgi:uncharacterized protein (DUF2237 family)
MLTDKDKIKMDSEKNILGSPLEACSLSPATGFKRNGHCQHTKQDFGVHGVCSEVTEEFLNFTKDRGNDLSSPNELYGFPGLKPGDKWCLCASRSGSMTGRSKESCAGRRRHAIRRRCS